MFDKFRPSLVLIVIVALTSWTGYRSYHYFTHNQKPDVDLLGIVADGHYARTMEGVLSANTSYKIDTVSIYIDNKLAWEKRIKAAHFQEAIALPTESLENGTHSLKIVSTDASYNRNSSSAEYQITIDNTPLKVSLEQEQLTIPQGKAAVLSFVANKKLADAAVTFMGSTYYCAPEAESSLRYQAYLPVDCEAQEGSYVAQVNIEDKVHNKQTLQAAVEIKHFEFKKQRGFSVDQTRFNKEKEISLSAALLEKGLKEFSAKSPKKKLWHGKFEMPIDTARMTTPFGEVRVTPERGRYMHRGVDLANRPKSTVWAAQEGVVVIKDRFEISGNTVVLDHGLGVLSVYAHLEDFSNINVGDELKKGQPVGRVGMTGYANGYHLHWEVRVNAIAVDPLDWTNSVY